MKKVFLGLLLFAIVFCAGTTYAVTAESFIYPVLPTGQRIISNVENPHNYDWYTTLDFGDKFDDPRNPAIKDCPDCLYHPAEDWNLSGGKDADVGKPIYSIGDGTVVKIESGNYGNTVLVRYELPQEVDFSEYFLPGTTPVEKYNRSKYVTAQYMHVDPTVELGQSVNKGDPIASISPQEYPHLHLELMVDPSADTRPSTARNGHGYYKSWQDITNYGYIDPSAFIADHTADIWSQTVSAVVDGNLNLVMDETLALVQSGNTITGNIETGLRLGDLSGTIYAAADITGTVNGDIWDMTIEWTSNDSWSINTDDGRYYWLEVGGEPGTIEEQQLQLSADGLSLTPTETTTALTWNDESVADYGAYTRTNIIVDDSTPAPTPEPEPTPVPIVPPRIDDGR